MALILNLETATRVCSVTLANDGEELATREINSENYSHSENLNLFIQEVLHHAGKTLRDVQAVAISEGPGSYTGLRIGTSSAKGICYALDIPLIAVNSLKSLASRSDYSGKLLCPMFDARRMEVYASIFDTELNELEPTAAIVVDQHSFSEYLNGDGLVFLGPGAVKCQEVIQHTKAIFELETAVTARGMIKLSEDKFNSNDFVDTAYFEPYYLKDFVAGPPKKLI